MNKPKNDPTKNGPNENASGAAPKKNAVQKLFLFFLPKASDPHSPCESVSMHHKYRTSCINGNRKIFSTAAFLGYVVMRFVRFGVSEAYHAEI